MRIKIYRKRRYKKRRKQRGKGIADGWIRFKRSLGFR